MAKRKSVQQREGILELLAEHRASGLSIAAFARERGISAWRLYDGRRALRKRDARKKSAGFVQVHVRPVPTASSPIEVELADGVRLQVPANFDADDLQRLLGVLASC